MTGLTLYGWLSPGSMSSPWTVRGGRLVVNRRRDTGSAQALCGLLGPRCLLCRRLCILRGQGRRLYVTGLLSPRCLLTGWLSLVSLFEIVAVSLTDVTLELPL